MPYFKSLTLNEWRQFESVHLDLSRQTTVLTGANGCGKTTILNVLSHHFGWQLQFVSTPFIGRRRKQKFFADRRRAIREEMIHDPNATPVGEIRYSDDETCTLATPPNSSSSAQYQLQYSRGVTVVGLHIPSHRPALTYQPVEQIPSNPKSNQQHYQEFQTLLLQTYGSANVRNPGLILKQSLISLALFGYGNSAVLANDNYRNLFEDFQRILKIILPENIGFDRLEIRMPDVVLITKTGDFSLDAMSGGINSLFGIAWQIHMYGADKSDCTVIIDEPENHLHPSMQRTLLRNLERAFPKYRFVIATHSPFVVTSNPNANVFALLHNSDGRVVSRHLESADLASSPEQTLMNILDVPTTVPLWVEERVREVLLKHSPGPTTPEQVRQIFEELKELGLNESIAQIRDMNANRSKK